MPFRRAAGLSDLSADKVTGVELGDTKVALYLVDGKPVATSDVCPHEECLLSEEGEVNGQEVECLCHGSKFNILTGQNTAPPATDPIAVYPVEVNGQDVSVDLG